MGTFLLLLCVLAALFSVGPLGLAPWHGLRGIRRQDVDAVEQTTKWTPLFGLGVTFTALIGAAGISYSDTYNFDSPWVIIAITLTVIMLALVAFWTIPTLRMATKLLRKPPADPEKETVLNTISDRLRTAASITLALLVAIIILVVTRPFGV